MIDNSNNYCHEAEKVHQDRVLPITTGVEEEGAQDTSTTSINSESTSTTDASSPTTKKISFGNCQIRTYPQVLGDHPCCLEGCPIQLGWNYQEEKSITLEDYENEKQQHNSKLAVLEQKQLYQQQEQEQDHELRLLPEERKRIILSTQEFLVREEDQPASSSSSSSSERKLFYECRKLNRKNILWSY